MIKRQKLWDIYYYLGKDRWFVGLKRYKDDRIIMLSESTHLLIYIRTGFFSKELVYKCDTLWPKCKPSVYRSGKWEDYVKHLYVLAYEKKIEHKRQQYKEEIRKFEPVNDQDIFEDFEYD